MNNELFYKKLNEAEILAGDCRENWWLYHAYYRAETLDKLKEDINRLKEFYTEAELLLKNTENENGGKKDASNDGKPM